MKIYRCEQCGAVAEVDFENNRILIESSAPKIPVPKAGRSNQVATSFPTHFSCELAKRIDRIDISKLEELESYDFRHKRGVPPI